MTFYPLKNVALSKEETDSDKRWIKQLQARDGGMK